MADVGCAGILVADMFCGPMQDLPREGQLLAIDAIEPGAGGCAANVAIGLVKQEFAVDLVACVGTDSSAQSLLQVPGRRSHRLRARSRHRSLSDEQNGDPGGRRAGSPLYPHVRVQQGVHHRSYRPRLGGGVEGVLPGRSAGPAGHRHGGVRGAAKVLQKEASGHCCGCGGAPGFRSNRGSEISAAGDRLLPAQRRRSRTDHGPDRSGTATAAAERLGKPIPPSLHWEKKGPLPPGMENAGE
jgi:hypothetical protein